MTTLIRWCGAVLGLGLGLAATAIAQNPFRVEVLDPAPVAGVPFAVRITALNADGLPDLSSNTNLILSAHQRGQPAPIITEIAENGEAIEITNPGTEPVDLKDWELIVHRTTQPEAQIIQRIPSLTLPAGGVMVWTSQPQTDPSVVSVVTPELANSPSTTWSAVQLHDASGNLVDQIRLRLDGMTPAPLRWGGPGLGTLDLSGGSRVRTGTGNRFNGSDWQRTSGSLGRPNPELTLPWIGSRESAVHVSEPVRLFLGRWLGSVTIPVPNPQVSLAVSVDGRRWVESALFSVRPAIPGDPSGERPRLSLGLEPGVPALLTEASPGTTRIRLAATGTSDLPVSVLLISDAPGEIQVPSSVVLPAGANPEIEIAVTNLDDTLPDGRAVVTLTASAPGFRPAHLTLLHDDNEAGTLWLQVEPNTTEGIGAWSKPGLVLLPEPAAHDMEVDLHSEFPLSVPDTVRIKAGAASAAFRIWVNDDDLVNAPGRTIALTASTAGWPPATAQVRVADDEVPITRVEWPREIVEGTPAIGRIHLVPPRDHRVEFRLRSESARIDTSSGVVVPPGSTNAEFFIRVANDGRADGSITAQVCLEREGETLSCDLLTVLDADIRPITQLFAYPPGVVFAGQPFRFEVLATAGDGGVQRTNFTGELVLSVDPTVARLSPESRALVFSNGVFAGPITVEGTALGATFRIRAGGVEFQTRPFDIVPGLTRSGPYLDMAVIPESRTLLLSTGTETNRTGRLEEMDPQTGAILRYLELPHPITRLAVSDNGDVAWLTTTHSALQRIDLEAWKAGPEIPVAASWTPTAISVLPGGTERVLALLSPVEAGLESPRLVAYDSGIALSQRVTIASGWTQPRLVPGRSSEEAFVGTLSELYRVRVDAQGVTLLEQTASPGDYTRHSNLVQFGDQLLHGDGTLRSADTLGPEGTFARSGFNLLQGCVWPDSGLAGFVMDSLQFQVFDLHTLVPVGRHGLEDTGWVSGAGPGVLLPCGQNRVALLRGDGNWLGIWEVPALTQPPADVEVLMDGPEILTWSQLTQPPFPLPWTITVTNRGPGVAHGVELFEGANFPTWIGVLSPGESRSFPRNPGVPGLGPVEFSSSVTSQGRDPDPSNNAAVTRSLVTSDLRGKARAVYLAMTDMTGTADGSRIIVALSRMPNSERPGLGSVDPVSATLVSTRALDSVPTRLWTGTAGPQVYALLGTNRIVRWNFKADLVDWDLTVTNETVLDLLELPGANAGVVVATAGGVLVYPNSETVPRIQTRLVHVPSRFLTWAGDRLWVCQPNSLRSFAITETSLQASGGEIPVPQGAADYPLWGTASRVYLSGVAVDIPTRQTRFNPASGSFLIDPDRDAMYSTVGNRILRHRLADLNPEVEEIVPTFPNPIVDELARWGDAGVAVRAGSELILIHTAIVPEGSADLAAHVSMPERLHHGEPFTLTLTVTNRSETPATRVRLRLRASGDVRERSFEPNDVYELYEYWVREVDVLEPHATAHLSLTGVLVSSSLNVEGQVLSSSRDPNPDDNVAWGSGVSTSRSADLALIGLEMPETVRVGETFDVQMVATNRGPEAIPNTAIEFTQAPGLRLIGVEGGELSSECCDGFRVAALPGVFEAGSTRTVRARFMADLPGIQGFRSQIWGLVDDPQPADNQSKRLLILQADATSTPRPPVGTPLVWNESQQQWLARIEGRFARLSPDLRWVNGFPLPGSSDSFVLTADGLHLWIAEHSRRAVLYHLETGASLAAVEPAENISVPFGAMLPVPGTPATLVVAGILESGSGQVTVYDAGQPRPIRYSGLQWSGNGIFLAPLSTNRVLVSTGSQLRELEITASGLVERRNLDPAAGYWAGTFRQAAGFLFYGNGEATDLEAGTRVQTGVLDADPAIQIGYRVQVEPLEGPGYLSVEAVSLPSFESLWHRSLAVTNARVTGLIPMGRRGVLLRGDQERLISSPDPASRSTDLGVVATLLDPVWGTNQTLTLALTATNRSPWSAHGVTVTMIPSNGLSLLDSVPDANGAHRLELGTLLRGSQRELKLVTRGAGPQSLQIEIEGQLPDSSPVDNTLQLTIDVPQPPVLLMADRNQFENTFAGELPVVLQLSSPAPAAFIAVFRVQHITTDASDVTSPEIHFEFSPGSVRASASVVVPDDRVEDDEVLRLVFDSGPVRPTRPEMRITLRNDDVTVLRFGSTEIRRPEGQAGLQSIQVPIQLDPPSNLPVEIAYRVHPGTATSGTDFLAQAGVLTIEPGQRTGNVTVFARGDTLFEPTETIWVTIDEIRNASLASLQSSVVLTNDDPLPIPSVRLEPALEGALQFRFDSVSGAYYRLQSRTNLVQGTWLNVGNGQWGTGAELSIPVPESPAEREWFRLIAE